MNQTLLSFKGERNYLRGADLYKQAMSLLSDQLELTTLSNISVKFPIFSQCEVEFEVCRDTIQPLNSIPLAMRLTASSGNSHITVLGRMTATPVLRREHFNEESLANAKVTESHALVIEGVQALQGIALIVAATKRLHTALLPPENNQQWFLTKFDLRHSAIERPLEHLEIQLEHRINDVHTCSSIKIEGKAFGNIYFYFGPPPRAPL